MEQYKEWGNNEFLRYKQNLIEADVCIELLQKLSFKTINLKGIPSKLQILIRKRSTCTGLFSK